ncbi:hypothetical protein B5P43_31110 [Bacillus sp. SRB_336]|nr:hypothetical protein B5P43_31110 [Bacillus sp. SRB_336]
MIRWLEPEIHARGGDHSPDMLAEDDEVAVYGGCMKVLDDGPDRSTTALVEKNTAARYPAG